MGAHGSAYHFWVPNTAAFVEKLTKTFCSKSVQKVKFAKFFGGAWLSWLKSENKLHPNNVNSAGWCFISEKTRPLTHNGAWKLCYKCAIWLLLIHTSTARLYRGEIVYKPRGSNRCPVPTYLRECRVPWSILSQIRLSGGKHGPLVSLCTF